MGEEHIETLRRVAQAADTLDPALLDELLAPDVCWHVRASGPDLVGTYQGIEEVRQFFARWAQPWDQWTWEWPEMRAIGDTVFTRMHLWGRGRQSGLESEIDAWQLWTFRGAKVVYYEDFDTREDALEAAGLS